jgi:hypothetical protein
MKIGVIGGGAWGTALAQRRGARGEPVTALGARARGGRRASTPGMRIRCSCRRGAFRDQPRFARPAPRSIRGCDALLVVAPAQHVRAVLAETPVGTTPLVLCAKGIEAGTRLLVGEVARQVHPDAPIAVLSGPDLRARSRCGKAHRGHARLRGRGSARALAERLAGPAFPALWLVRRDRRRDRRRGQECARHRVRRGRRRRARAECPRRADRARFCRDDALRPGAWRAGRDAGRPVGPWRSRADLLLDQFAQLLARRRARPGQECGRRPARRSPHRRGRVPSPRRCCAKRRPKPGSTCRWPRRSAPCSKVPTCATWSGRC